MKKFLAVLLAFTLVVGLAACGAAKTTSSSAASSSKASSAASSAASSSKASSAASSSAASSSKASSAAASSAAKKDPKNMNIAVVLKTLSSEYWNYVKSGCDAAAKELGCKITVVGPGAESDIDGQVAMIEQQIGTGCDAIICAPNDAGAATKALQAAIDKKIPVLAVDTDVGIKGETAFVGTSNVDAAKKGGEYAAKIAGKDAKAVIIYGQEGDNTSNMRKQGYEAACKAAGITILSELSGQNTTDGATKTMEDMLNAHPNEIKIVLCHNDDTAIGAMNACKAAGVKGMTIIGFDGNKSAVNLILSGDLTATVAQQPYMMGKQVVEAAVKAVNGEKVEAKIVADVKVVEKSNGQQYLNDLASYLK